jgi:hypothetical protein
MGQGKWEFIALLGEHWALEVKYQRGMAVKSYVKVKFFNTC